MREAATGVPCAPAGRFSLGSVSAQVLAINCLGRVSAPCSLFLINLSVNFNLSVNYRSPRSRDLSCICGVFDDFDMVTTGSSNTDGTTVL